MVQWLTLQLYIGQKPFPILEDSELAILSDGFVIFISLLRGKLSYFKVIYNCFILVLLIISNVNATEKVPKKPRIID